MATILRAVSRQRTRVLASNVRPRNIINPVVFISTSDKKKDSHAAAPEIIGDPKKFENWNVPENWVSYGYSYDDPGKDRFYRTFMQHCVIGSIMWTSFIYLYKPEINLRHHAKREAYLEIERRRKAGLPIIDPNLVDPDSVILPTDEELGPDFEVII